MCTHFLFSVFLWPLGDLIANPSPRRPCKCKHQHWEEHTAVFPALTTAARTPGPREQEPGLPKVGPMAPQCWTQPSHLALLTTGQNLTSPS